MGTYLDMSWHSQAACREVDFDWYAEADESHMTVKELAAKIGLNESSTRRALNGYDRVSVEVLDQVIEGVQEHGFRCDRSRDPNYLGMLRAVCDSCPVIDKCSAHALKHERFGFWAGTTASERRAIRSKRGMVVDDPMYAVGRESDE